jgi:hypothetical protein
MSRRRRRGRQRMPLCGDEHEGIFCNDVALDIADVRF